MRTDLYPVRALTDDELVQLRRYRRDARQRIFGALIMAGLFWVIGHEDYQQGQYRGALVGLIGMGIFLLWLMLSVIKARRLSDDIMDGYLYRIPADKLSIVQVYHRHKYISRWRGTLDGRKVKHEVYLADKRLLQFAKPPAEPEWYITTAHMNYVADIEMGEDVVAEKISSRKRQRDF